MSFDLYFTTEDDFSSYITDISGPISLSKTGTVQLISKKLLLDYM